MKGKIVVLIDEYTASIGELKEVKDGDRITGYVVEITNSHTTEESEEQCGQFGNDHHIVSIVCHHL